MIARGAGGSIVSISSIAGSSALGRGNFVYSVTKAGIIQLTRELAVEWAPHRIRVNAIQPAQVMTKAMDRMLADPRLDPATLKERFVRGIPLDRIGEPEDIAKAVVFLASDAALVHHRPQPARRRRQPRAQRGRQQALAHGHLTRPGREDLDGHSERDDSGADARAGARALPRDGGDPADRGGAGQGPRRRPDPGRLPHLRRRGGGRDRRVGPPPPGRHGAEHSPGSRPRAGEGRPAARADGRAVRAGHRLLARARRQHAPLRARGRAPRARAGSSGPASSWRPAPGTPTDSSAPIE